MLLRFPCQADYVPVFDNGIMLFLSHGHVYAPHNMPSLYGASLFLYGHTHLWELNCNNEGMWFCNPGSISLPKEGRPASFAVYDNGTIAIYTLSGELLAQSDVKVATYPRLLQQAIALATEAHAGQVDRAGMPYITHPLRVMEAIFFDRKLITTNASIKDFGFYNPSNILVFEVGKTTARDIIDFFKKDFIPYSSNIKDFYSLDKWIARFQ